MVIVDALRDANCLFQYIRLYSLEDIMLEVSESICMARDKFYGTEKKRSLYYYFLLDLKEHIGDYAWLYLRLEEELSRYVLWKLLCYRLVPDLKFIRDACDRRNQQYFDPAIISCGHEEVFADCGGFIGDTAAAFIETYKKYKKIYIFEPSEENREICRKNLAPYPAIDIIAAGVSDRRGQASFSKTGSSSKVVDEEGDTETIDLVALDEVIEEPVDFIKMDIEGLETEAIYGAKRHIREDRPKLAICVYHKVSDIWWIPRLVERLLPSAKFYLRHYREDQPWETVFYAVPAERAVCDGDNSAREKAAAETKPAVYVLPAFPLQNVQLLKDRIVIPYVFTRHFGRGMTVVTKKVEDYPYLEYLPGVRLEALCYDGGPEELDHYVAAASYYITEHHKDMDILFLFGIYSQYSEICVLYKKLRPEGKIYLKLDANSYWTDRIDTESPVYRELFGACDVISCESMKLQRLLSKKWPWRIDYIPNGYYAPLIPEEDTGGSQEKEDVILTVGRIGTEQKNNRMLLEAFAEVEDQIPGWSVRLVGSVTPEFAVWTEAYLEAHPRLRGRILLTGPVTDRRKLFREYRRAKVFVLTSIYEGGFPNVYAEAAITGCNIIVTDIDSAGDMTDGGRLGEIIPSGDTAALAEAILSLCQDETRIRQNREGILEYAQANFNYDRIVERLDLLLRLG